MSIEVGSLVRFKSPEDILRRLVALTVPGAEIFVQHRKPYETQVFRVEDLVEGYNCRFVTLRSTTTGELIDTLGGINIGDDCLELAESKYPSNYAKQVSG